MSGTATTNLPLSDSADDVIGNAAGSTIRVSMARLAALLGTLQGPAYGSVTQLQADTAWPAGAIGSVYGGTAAQIGVYRKSGAPGSGSWSRIGDLPVSSITAAQLSEKAALADLTAEIAYRRAAIRDAGIMPLANVTGRNSITATLTPSMIEGGATLANTSTVELIPAETSDGPVQLSLDGATPVPVRDAAGAELQVGALLAGRSYFLRRRGSTWRIIAGGISSVEMRAEAQARMEGDQAEAQLRLAGDRAVGVHALSAVGGSASAITAELGFPEVPGETKVILVPAAESTGPVTLRLGTGPIRSIMSADSASLSAGDLKAGIAVLLRLSAAGDWRLVGVGRSEIAAAIAVESQARVAAHERYLGVQRVGNASLAAYSASTQVAGGTVLFNAPLSSAAYPYRLRCRASSDGTFFLQRYAAEVSGRHRCLGEIAVPIKAGDNDIELSPTALFGAGERIGYRTDTVLALAAGATNSNIYYVGTGVVPGEDLVDATTQTYASGVTISLRSGAEVPVAAALENVKQDIAAAAAGTAAVAQSLTSVVATGKLGNDLSQGYQPSGNPPVGLCIVQTARAAAPGIISRVRGRMKVAGTLVVQVFRPLADGVAHTCISEKSITLPVGDFDVSLIADRIPVRVGDRLGYRTVDPGMLTFMNRQIPILWGDGANAVATLGQTIQLTKSQNHPFAIEAEVAQGPVHELAIQLGDLASDVQRDRERTAAMQSWPFELVSVEFAAAGSGVTTQVRHATAPSTETRTVSISTTHMPAATGLGRYDLICFSPATGAASVVAGAEKARGLAGWVPASPRDGRIVLGTVRMSDAGIVQVVPTWRRERSGWGRNVVQTIQRARVSNLQAIRRWVQRVEARQPLKILAVGDSITQAGAGTASMAVPNGTGRDVVTYLSGQQDTTGYTPEYVASVPLFTGAQIGRTDAATNHAKIGQVWYLVDELVARGYQLGSTLVYDNFAVSAKSSYDLIGDDGALTAWGTAVRDFLSAQRHNLVILTHGMNEQGGLGTWGRLARLAAVYQDLGADVVICDAAQPRSSADRAGIGRGKVRQTRAQTWQAAKSAGAAHVSWSWLDEDDCLEGLGIADIDLGAANGGNHPGVEELAAMGRLMAHVLLP
ncbi:hypothetical protein [Paracoccus sanguinis]|uniref:hypothetical protein n=1 Tax=Paracoccus sanguinis TaxID=1545044 RepID=UPI00056704B1|nr:hypothetical protein [Paracoccus sanguinis]